MITKKNLISLKNICLSDKNKIILDNISFNVESNQIITIVGPNGGGKSSLLKVLLKLRPQTSGEVIHADDLVIGYMPQNVHFDQNLPITVERFLRFSAKKDKASFNKICDFLNITHLLKSSIHHLSGGEVQRMLLARACLNKPNLLVLDEPGQGLDLNGQTDLYRLINLCVKELNTAVVMVSHDLNLVMAHTDEVICINQHLCCAGHPQEISNDPKFKQIFGASFVENMAFYSHHHNHCHKLDGSISDLETKDEANLNSLNSSQNKENSCCQ